MRSLVTCKLSPFNLAHLVELYHNITVVGYLTKARNAGIQVCKMAELCLYTISHIFELKVTLEVFEFDGFEYLTQPYTSPSLPVLIYGVMT